MRRKNRSEILNVCQCLKNKKNKVQSTEANMRAFFFVLVAMFFFVCLSKKFIQMTSGWKILHVKLLPAFRFNILIGKDGNILLWSIAWSATKCFNSISRHCHNLRIKPYFPSNRNKTRWQDVNQGLENLRLLIFFFISRLCKSHPAFNIKWGKKKKKHTNHYQHQIKKKRREKKNTESQYFLKQVRRQKYIFQGIFSPGLFLLVNWKFILQL